MKTLLTTLNSKYIHSNLALRYLYGACSPEQRENIEVKEFTINNTDEMIFVELMRSDCEIMAFSCYIWNIEKTLRIVEQIKAVKPVTIILGGPEVSFGQQGLLQHAQYIDYVISGEGETVLPELLNAIETGERNPRTMAGVAGRIKSPDSGNAADEIFVKPAGDFQPFELSPFPYEHMKPENDKVIYYESSRGCPFRCSYCLSSVMKNVRALPIDRVKKEIMYFLQGKFKQVKFIDRTFNFDKKRSYELTKFIIDNDNDVTNFHFELCGDLIDADYLKLISGARKDLFQFEIGVQSTDSHVLGACNRKTDFTLMADAIAEIIKNGNIHIHLDLIAGLPYDTYEGFEKSFNDVFALRPDALQLGFLKLLKGSPIREHADEYGYVFRSTPPYEVLSNDFMTAGELVKLKMIDTVFDLWYNRGGFTHTLEYLLQNDSSFKNSSFKLFEELADFYYVQGYQNRNHKKEDLYRMFLKFCHDDAQVKEMLSQDMDETLNFDAVKKFIRKGWEIS